MSQSKIYTVFKGTDREFTGSKVEIAKYFNKNRQNLNKIMRNHNLSLEEAIDYNPYNITVFKDTDKEFTGSLRKICQHFNVSADTIRYRMKIKHFSIEEAIEWENDNYDIIVFKGTNKEFKGNKKEIVTHFNLSEYNFYNRLRNGYTPEEAIEIPRNLRNNVFSYKGEKDTLKNLCKKYNKNYIDVYKLMKQNYSIEYVFKQI